MNENTNIYRNNNYSPSSKNEEIVIVPNDALWGEKLKNYQKSKDIFYFNKKDFPKIIKKELVMSNQGEFNPITQRYIDPKKDNLINKESNQRKLNYISNGYDKQLEVESTYNIINLSNKLKYFNYEEPITKTVPNQNINKDKNKENQFNFNYETRNKKPYNILTNLSLKEHNFLSPKLRPVNNEQMIKNCKDGLSEFDKKDKKMDKDTYNRDYNIINNEYKIFNKEKKETDLEIINTHLQKILQIKRGRFYYLLNKKNMN